MPYHTYTHGPATTTYEQYQLQRHGNILVSPGAPELEHDHARREHETAKVDEWGEMRLIEGERD